jgi:hypothetical protein
VMVKRIKDRCSVKKVDYLWSLVGSDAQGTNLHSSFVKLSSGPIRRLMHSADHNI